ncbi:hypothetical protein B9Z55_027889 [Caenorhabditis nigoni]|uniref:DNA2/NAM7 helicase-like C-terminal domain-containing protein n=1 Tax=Caenorhabditis nigoni TaxID=1611254 RepID=A0A2G5SEF4_9PELO|nr:hypothetical protein B9Z55_027889 [Caenorhabditis nigoni]
MKISSSNCAHKTRPRLRPRLPLPDSRRNGHEPVHVVAQRQRTVARRNLVVQHPRRRNDRIPRATPSQTKLHPAQRNFMTHEFSGMFVGSNQQYEQGQIPSHAVDTFQGREGKVVIVSLVRSHRGVPENTAIGFLAVPNRIYVALTRAQHGMYNIGNAPYLSKAGRLWNNLVNSNLDQQVGKE